MATIYADAHNIDELIKEGMFLLDFYADWCGPCKVLNPVLEQMDEENDDFKIVKVNVDENVGLAQQYGVQGIPALFLVKDGEVVKRKAGFFPKDKLIEWIREE